MLPPGVTKRQWRLAAIYPRAESAYQALIQAGYKPVTALASAKRSLGSVGVQRAAEAIEARETGKRDKARAHYERAGDILGDRLDSMRDEVVLATWKTSADILASGIGDTQTQREFNTPQWYRAQTRRALERAWKLGFVAGSRPQQVVLSPPPVAKRRKKKRTA